jgi:hypothetical protein
MTRDAALILALYSIDCIGRRGMNTDLAST